MSILGIGHDLVEVDRIRRALALHGERFLERCFTAEERRFCELNRDPAPGLAARFAAKEAAAKALGTGISQGIAWVEIEVRREDGAPPTLHFHGRAAAIAKKIGVKRTHVSLTHARETAGAFVVLEG